MMNQWIVPNLNQRQQRQERVEGEEMNTSPPHHHLRTDQNLTYVASMAHYEVAELTWENGQLGLHGFGTGNNFPCHQTKLSTWSREEEDTLESIVHQATFSNSNSNINISQSNGKLISGKWGEKSSSHSNLQGKQSVGTKLSPIGESLGEKWKENLGPEKNYGLKSSSMNESLGGKRVENSGGLDLIKKRVRVIEEENCGKKRINEVEESESATFFSRDFRDVCMRRFEESAAGSMRNTRNTDDNSAFSENHKEERATKDERLTHSTPRRSHAAAIHNQSERRRRDRINEKMKALQKLVPNASKTDKASMLDEVIEHLKQLQAQIQMMSNARNMSQMVMPLGMQQQLQMSLLARMGMGMGMGNVPQSLPPLINPAAPFCGATPPFVSPSYVVPSVIPPLPPVKSNYDASTINTSVSLSEAYNTFLAQQSMNMDFFNKMTSLYKQKANQYSKNLSQTNDGRGK